MNKIVIFGAGKIGRSFIGQLFACGGYEVIFIDISASLVKLLNSEKKYPVIIKDENEEIIWVKNVRALHISQEESIIEEILDAKYISVSVGIRGLAAISPILAKAINSKFNKSPGRKTDIILAENIRNGDLFLEQELRKSLPVDFPINDVVGLLETSIGKMVPIMPESVVKSDPLIVYAEAYNTLIVSSNFKNEIPEIEGLAPKDNIKAWVDRKLFIHNLGHAATAYLGNFFHPVKNYIHEVLEDDKVEKAVRNTMAESAAVLQRMYPEDFTSKELNNHINDLIRRFKNVSLGDTVFRVGSDLSRKLSSEDRFISPLKHAIKFDLGRKHILYAYCCVPHFRATDENDNPFPGDLNIISDYQKNGIGHILKNNSGLDPIRHIEVFSELEQINQVLYQLKS